LVLEEASVIVVELVEVATS